MKPVNESSVAGRIRFCSLRERRNQPQIEASDAIIEHAQFNEEEYWEAQSLIEEKEAKFRK